MENEFVTEFVKEYGIDYEDIYISKRHPYLIYNIGGFRERFPVLIKFDEFKYPSILVYLFNDSLNKKNFFGSSISKNVVESYNFSLYLYKMIRRINLLNIKDKNSEIKDYMECNYYDQLDKFYSDITNRFFPSNYENKFIKNYRYINTNFNLPDINNNVVGCLMTTGNFPMFEMVVNNIRNILKHNSIKFTYGKYKDFTEEMIGICNDITNYTKNSEIVNFIRQEFLNKDFTIKYFNGLQGKVKFIYDYDQFNGKNFDELNEDYFISNNELFKLNLVTY